MYRAYEDLINMDSNIRLEHMTNGDKALGKVRKCFQCIETYVVSDNYFKLISGHLSAPYPECQPIQTALEHNSLEYLTLLAGLEVNSVNRILEQAVMYQDGKAMSNMSTSPTPHNVTTPVTTVSEFYPC